VNGKLSCQAKQAPFLRLYDRCEPSTDSCTPGMSCIYEVDSSRPDCGAHCYKYCRTGADCPANSKCDILITVDAPGSSGVNSGGMACSPPPDNCQPFGPAHCSDTVMRPPASFACYVSTDMPDSVSCQCAGTIAVNQPCTRENDCVAGHQCVSIAGAGVCKRVCLLNAPATQLAARCLAPQTCVPFRGASKYGYCL
jgi:hypothetical protein